MGGCVTERRTAVSGDDAFVGRSTTLAALAAHLEAVRADGRGRLVAVRGRRQVGKSAAVERFAQAAGVPYVFATGVFRGSTADQLEAWRVAVHQSPRPLPDADVLYGSAPATWRDALAAVGVAARPGPVLLVLDEFPWMCRADPTLESVLQAAWDRSLEKMPVLVVLIGSDVAMMEELATHGRPLFGRVHQLVIQPLDLGEVAQALPGWPAAGVVDAYLVTGGFPRLVVDLARSRKPLAPYVRGALADAFHPLLATGRLVLDAEFPDAPAAARILAAIGADDSGHPRFGTLAAGADPSQRKAAETALTRALGVLTQTKGLIEAETPAWSPPGSKMRRYRVADLYLRFWFRYVDRYASLVERGRADVAIDHFDRDWTSWRGRSVEPLVRQSLLRLAPRLGLDVRSVAPWWSRDGQHEVDAVGLSGEATEFVGTIKWRERRGIDAHDLADLQQARALVPRAGHARLVAVCRQGARPEGADLVLTAEDIVDAWQVAP